jgi:hypothetical protein
VWSINIIRCIQRFHMAKYTSRGTAITMTRQIFDKATSNLYNGYRVYFPGVKRPERDVDHLPHSVPNLKEEYSYTSASPLGLHGLFKGEYTLPYPSTCVCRRFIHLALRKNVRFGDISTKMETYKNATRIKRTMCIRIY